MQVYSMTGYASVQNQSANLPHGAGGDTLPNGRLGVEIRSVNSRFLDLSFRLPDELRSMEPVLRQMLTGGLKRGKVELRAAIDIEKSSSIAAPSEALLQSLQRAQAQGITGTVVAAGARAAWLLKDSLPASPTGPNET